MVYAVHLRNGETGENFVKRVEANNGFKAMRKAGVEYGNPLKWIASEPFNHILGVATKIGEDTFTVPEWYGFQCK